jgi:hypothetical protein
MKIFDPKLTGSIEIQSPIPGVSPLTASWAQSVVGGGSSQITVADEGTSQGTATFLNFEGAGVSATVNDNTASINIPGGSGETFPYTGSAIISGSLIVTGSVRSSGGFTGSLLGTSSWAQNAITASFVTLAQTASYVLNAVSASFATTAATASSADNFFIRNNITASNGLFTGTITAQTLVVQTVTSSVAFVTGSTKFGSSSVNTHQFTGSVSITGSLNVVGPATINNLTGSLFGTSSWAQNAVTASFALNAGASTALTVADEGTAQGTATFLNFVGAGVTATVTSNTASINIPGGSGETFPYTGSAIISGSLIVTGSTEITGSLRVTGSLIVSGSQGYGVFSKGVTLADLDNGFTVTGSYFVWRSPFPCRVVSVYAIKSGSSQLSINVRRSGSGASLHLASNLNITANNLWTVGGTVQNTDYSIGDSLELIISGSDQIQASVQVDFIKR